jgi:hypothetical protein
MDLVITDEEEQITRRFLWSRLSSDDRIQQLLVSLGELDPHSLLKLVTIANQEYMKSRIMQDSVLYQAYFSNKKIDPLQLISWIMVQEYLLPIVLDTKLIYSDQLKTDLFNKFIEKNYSEPITSEQKGYQNLLIKSQKGEEVQSGVKISTKYTNIIGDEHNPVSEYTPIYSHRVKRYSDSKGVHCSDKQFESILTPTTLTILFGVIILGFNHIHCRYWLNEYNKFDIYRDYFDKVNKNIMKLSWPFIADKLTNIHYLLNNQFSLSEINKFISNIALENSKIRSDYTKKINEKIKFNSFIFLV